MKEEDRTKHGDPFEQSVSACLTIDIDTGLPLSTVLLQITKSAHYCSLTRNSNLGDHIILAVAASKQIGMTSSDIEAIKGYGKQVTELGGEMMEMIVSVFNQNVNLLRNIFQNLR